MGEPVKLAPSQAGMFLLSSLLSLLILRGFELLESFMSTWFLPSNESNTDCFLVNCKIDVKNYYHFFYCVCSSSSNEIALQV